MPDLSSFGDDLQNAMEDQEQQTTEAADARMSGFRDALSQQIGARDAILKASIESGRTVNPDTRARAMELAKVSRLPVTMVEQDIDEVASHVRTNYDPAVLRRDHPELASWLEHPDRAAISNDDLPVLRQLDVAARSMRGEDPTGILPKGYLFDGDKIIQPLGDGSLANVYNDLNEVERHLDSIGDRESAREIGAELSARQFDEEWGWAGNLMAGAGQSLQASQRALGILTEYDREGDEVIDASLRNAPGWFGDVQRGVGGLIADVPLMLAGGPVAEGVSVLARMNRARGMLSTVVGRTAARRLGTAGKVAVAVQPLAIREGITEGQDHGLVDGALAWLTETTIPGAFGRTGVERLIVPGAGDVVADGWRGAVKRLLVDAGMEGTEEAVTEWAHAVRERATGADPTALDPDKLWRRLTVAGAVGAVAGGGFSLPSTIADKFIRDGEEARRAEVHADRLGNIKDILAQSKTNERAPGEAESLVESMLGQGNRHQFIEAEDFRDAFADPAAAADALGVSQEYATAIATNGQVQVPTARLLQRAAKDEEFAKLLDIARRDPAAKNKVEAAEFTDKAPDAIGRLHNEAKAQLEGNKATPHEKEVDEIAGEMFGRLDKVMPSHLDRSILKEEAGLVSRMIGNLAKASGKTPKELFRLRIKGDAKRLLKGDKFDLFDAMLERLRKQEIPSDRDVYGASLVDFLREKGISDATLAGELKSLHESDRTRKPGERNLVRDDGRNLDDARAAAIEAGFLPEGADINELLAKLDDEVRGGVPAFSSKGGNPQMQAAREALDMLNDSLRVAGIKDLSLSNKEIRAALVALEERQDQALGQDGAVIDAPKNGRLDVDALLRQWRKATGDRTPIGGFESWAKMVAEAREVDEANGTSLGQGERWRFKTQEVLAKLPNKAPSEQIRKTLLNNGVNERELFWLGIDDLLKSSDVVSKADIEALLADPKLKLDETVKSQAAFTDAKEAKEYIAFIDKMNDKDHGQLTIDEAYGFADERDYITLANQLAEKHGLMKGSSAKFGDYTLPGGKNYRELLITLPDQGNRYKASDLTPIDDGDASAPRPDLFWYFQAPDNVFQIPKSKHATREDAARYIVEKKKRNAVAGYQSSHWSERNVLLHTRFNERVDSTGTPVLHIEEIQSDWHQAGRENGYASDAKAVTDQEVRDHFGLAEGVNLDLYRQEYMDSAASNGRRVPDAPFAKTWEEIGLKRMIRQAVEQGITRITWTTGEQQADRYDLGKQVDQIRYKKNADGTFDVWAANEYGGSLSDELDRKSLTPAQVGDFVGKEMAQRIVDGAGRETDGEMVLEGVDLKVGGEGMKAAYDQRLVSIANKIGKKYGVKAGTAEFKKEGLSDKRLENEFFGRSLEDDPPTVVHSLDITPEMAVDAMGGMHMLFQPEKGKGKGRRGEIDIDVNKPRKSGRTYTVTMFETADVSTFLHEAGGHMMLELFADLAAAPGASDALKADWQDILDWLGAKDIGSITEDMHEQYARGFEAYLMEGKAPSSALRTAFARLKTWLLAIYKSVRNLDVTLTPEIRGVFDRLVMAEDAADLAEASNSMDAMLPREAFDTLAEWIRYQESIEASREASRDRMRTQLVAQFAKDAKRAWEEQRVEVHADVEREVDARPVYQVLSALQRGTLPDGTRLPDEYQGMKLSRADLVEQWGEEVLTHLPGPKGHSDNKANRGGFMYSADAGLPVDQVARMWGFPSGDAMIEALIQADDRASLIETETAKRMTQLNPDPATDGSITDRANAALATDQRAELLRRELNALGRRTGQTPAPVEILREVARERIAKEQLYKLTPDKFRVAAAKAARMTVDHAANQRWDEAYRTKTQEILNLELYRAAKEAKDASEQGRVYLRTFDTLAKRQRIGKAGGWIFGVFDADENLVAEFGSEDEARAAWLKIPDATYRQTNGYLEQIEAILDGFKLRRKSNLELRRKEQFRKWIARNREEGEDIVIDDKVIDDLGERNWNDLTVEEQSAVIDAVRNIEARANFKDRLLKNHRARTMEQARTDLVTAIVREHPKQVKDRQSKDVVGAVLDAPGRFIDAARKDSYLAYSMDGYKDGGMSWEYFIRPRNEAMTAAELSQMQEGEAFRKLFAEWGKSKGMMAGAIKGTTMRLRLEERVMVAAHWGNAEGRDRILKRFKLTRHGMQDVTAVLDSLDAKDWALVNGIVRLIGKHWSDVAALERRSTGIPPEKVRAVPIVTSKHGVQAGGYIPLKYDEDLSKKAGDLAGETAARENARAMGARAQTRHGHTNLRARMTEGLAVRLDFGVIAEHIAEVVHDLHHREMLMDQNRLLRDEQIAGVIIDHHGRRALRELVQTNASIALRGAASGVLGALSPYAAKLRRGVSASVFTYSLTSALMNVTGFLNSLARVGPLRLLGALGRIGMDAVKLESTFTWVDSKSGTMKTRGGNVIREVGEAMREIGTEGWGKRAIRWGYLPMRMVQRAVDTVTWVGAYEQTMADLVKSGLTFDEAEAKAIAIADQIVTDTQGSARIGDLSAIERDGELSKLFTMFFSWMNTTQNLQRAQVGRILRNKTDPKALIGAATVLLLTGPVQVVMTDLIRAVLRGDDRDDEERLQRMARQQAGFLLGQYVLARELSGPVEGGYDYSGPASMRSIAEAAKLAQAATKGDLDAGDARTVINLGGALTGAPSRAVNQLVDAWKAAEDGATGTEALRIALFGKPLK